MGDSLEEMQGVGHLPTSLHYGHAVVLKQSKRWPEEARKLHEKALRRLVSSGLKVLVLSPGETNRDRMCILVDAGEDLMRREVKRLDAEMWVKHGFAPSSSMRDEEADRELSPADRVSLLDRLVRRALKDYDAEDGVHKGSNDKKPPQHTMDVVADIFPLQDEAFNDKFLRRIAKVSYRPDRWGWAVDEMRWHFGERTAFYFAFAAHYTRWIVPAAVFGAIYYLAVRFISFPAYNRGLAVLGFFMISCWGPLMMKFWRRESARLSYRWGLHGDPPALENPEFEYELRVNPKTKAKQPYYNSRKRLKWKVFVLIFSLIMIVAQMFVWTPFIQWFVWSTTAPLCSDCEAQFAAGNTTTNCRLFVTCFNSVNFEIYTLRGLYILLQGITLGLIINLVLFSIVVLVTNKVTEVENHPTLQDVEKHLIRRQFGFIWMANFFYFVWTAFVYVPFGGEMQQFLLDTPSLSWMAAEKWEPRVLSVETTLLTPLVINQLLNLFADTFLPTLFTRIAVNLQRKAHTLRNSSTLSSAYSGFMEMARLRSSRSALSDDEEADAAAADDDDDGSADELVEPKEVAVDVDGGRPEATLIWADGQLNSESIVKAVRAQLQVDIPYKRASGDEFALMHEDVVYQQGLGEHDPMWDYMTQTMQFAYVVMFSVAWAWTPLCALVNNLLEFPADAWRMLHSRRPVPRKDNGIGEWKRMQHTVILLGIPVVAGLITLGTGQAEHWLGCGSPDSNFMGPDLTCFSSWGTRLACFIFIEHVGMMIYAALTGNIDDVPSDVRQALEDDEELHRRAVSRSMLPDVPPGMAAVMGGTMKEAFTASAAGGEQGVMEMDDLATFLKGAFHLEDVEPVVLGMLFELLDKDGSGNLTYTECVVGLTEAWEDTVLRRLLKFDQLGREDDVWEDDSDDEEEAKKDR
eukprot:PLAT1807.2.p1 GENE.PLAT1807.2~~PLAT1807.2.p1  ORF type:complete len:915 (+),score=486.63 PLAT1807.2:128-2872(+)